MNNNEPKCKCCWGPISAHAYWCFCKNSHSNANPEGIGMTIPHTQPAGCDLDSLEALARAATPGPWAYQEDSDAYTHIVRPVASPGWIIASATQTSKPEGEANGRWIAAANPTTVLSLIAAARAAQAPQGDTRQGAHTCTPADERALFEAWYRAPDKEGLRFPVEYIECKNDDGTYEHKFVQNKWEGWQARAAQGAGTAPVGLEPVEGDLLPPVGSKVLIHLARQDAWVEHTVSGYYVWGALRHQVREGEKHAHRVFVRVKDAKGYDNARLLSEVRPAAHPAPVSTAAATTASASGTVKHRDVLAICDAYESGIGHGLQQDGHDSGTIFGNPVHGIAYEIGYDEGNSRAADGQQGASRAALDELVTRLRNCLFKNVPPYRGDLEAACDLLARNLPAQGAAQVEVEAARECTHWSEATKARFGFSCQQCADERRAAQSRAQSDTTGDRDVE